ncbi:MAG: outer membrane beta-barrel protein [Bacteroidetes bacterium]|nr:outer membrane beta-barrel protein [Bacteroidota bacterium]
MKKATLLLILTTFGISAFAQNFKLGLNASPNIGWLSSTDNDIDDDFDYTLNGSPAKIGIGYGLMFEYGFTDNYLVNVNVNHLMTGGKFEATHLKPSELTQPNAGNDASVYFATKYSPVRLNYLYIPATLRLKTNEIGYMKYFGNIGFAGAFNLGSKTDITLSYFEYDSELDAVNTKTDIEKPNLKFQPKFMGTYFVVGGGGQYSMGENIALHFGLDVNVGLGGVVSRREYETYSNLAENATIKNSFVALNIGIFL